MGHATSDWDTDKLLNNTKEIHDVNTVWQVKIITSQLKPFFFKSIWNIFKLMFRCRPTVWPDTVWSLSHKTHLCQFNTTEKIKKKLVWVPPKTSPTSKTETGSFLYSAPGCWHIFQSASRVKTIRTWCDCDMKFLSNRCFCPRGSSGLVVNKKLYITRCYRRPARVKEWPRSDGWVWTRRAAWPLLGNFWVCASLVFRARDVSPWQPYIRQSWVFKTSSSAGLEAADICGSEIIKIWFSTCPTVGGKNKKCILVD